ncbi:translation elongation factor EF-4 [Paenarthrobacter nicotinovorans]|uniref:PqqD family protein n=1 Tax=Paenarthrobacter nicotinovorans TaxID=29320 RepID=A0ABV0GQZ8_PAENI|nr:MULTISPECIES: PqqD family protein [Micrococcaceae]MDR6438223.1 translation elongation factor EF-4 [Paenarthrobacter nicotinovorans]SCZ52621.1 Coenzyme PQQ synthesis protein D (PqqD) [Arthrobacter sp. UNCCL28]
MRKNTTRTVEAGDVFQPSPKITFNVDDDGVTVFDARGGTYWRGNATAADVMAAIEQNLQVGDVVDKISESYGVDPHRVRRDVHALIGELQQSGIIRRVSL